MAQLHAVTRGRWLLMKRLAALEVPQRSQLCVKLGTLHRVLKHRRQLQGVSLNSPSYLHIAEMLKVLHLTK